MVNIYGEILMRHGKDLCLSSSVTTTIKEQQENEVDPINSQGDGFNG